MNKRQALREAFTASFTNDGDTLIPDPIETGAAKRGADNSGVGDAKPLGSGTNVGQPKGSEASPKRPADKEPPQGDKAFDLPKTKSGLLVDLLSRAAKMKRSDLIDAYTNGNLSKSLREAEGVSTPRAAIAEDLHSMLDEAGLSEDFRTKAAVLFEAAVNLRVAADVAAIEEKLVDKYTDLLAAELDGLNEQADAYLSKIAADWMEENRLAVETGIRVELAESFIGGIKKVFAEHYVEIPEDRVDVVEEMAATINTLEEEIEQHRARAAKLEEAINSHLIESILDEATEGLPQTIVDKIRVMAEGISHDNHEDFAKRVAILRESLFAEKGASAGTLVLDSEADDEVGALTITDPTMQRYAAAISRLGTKNA